MKTEDLAKVLEVLETADGGCSHCITNLIIELIGKFPKLKDEILDLQTPEARESLEQVISERAADLKSRK